MRLAKLVFSIGLLAAAASAHADILTYNISGYINTDPSQAITLVGTTTIDVNNVFPSVLSIFLKFANGTTQSGIGTLGQDHGHNAYVGVANDLFSFTDDLHNYTTAGGTFNLRDASGDYVGHVFSGTLTIVPPSPPTAVAQTPEPPSLALLGTGLIGVLGLVGRRLARSNSLAV